MANRLWFDKTQITPRTTDLMLVCFRDNRSNSWDWAPTWEQAKKVFLELIRVERSKNPRSKWLREFAQIVQEALKGAQIIESAYKVSGRLERYKGQKLKIDVGSDELMVTPGFEVTESFLDDYLDTDVELFVVDDLAMRVRRLGSDGRVIKEYPLPQS